MIKKIWFCGSHSTGKSNQCDYFIKIHPEFTKLATRRREFFDCGIININKKASPLDELIIAGDIALAIASTSSPFISERSFVDKCAYSQALPFSEELLNAWHTININSFPGITDEEIYFYFPPMFPIEDDGVRNLDPEYQKEIDFLIQFYLDLFKISFITIDCSSVQDRHMLIEKIVFNKT